MKLSDTLSSLQQTYITIITFTIFCIIFDDFMFPYFDQMPATTFGVLKQFGRTCFAKYIQGFEQHRSQMHHGKNGLNPK